MANFLQQLGQGLRIAGASTSQGNFSAFDQQNQAQEQQRQKGKELALGLIVQGIQNGVIDEKTGREAIRRLQIPGFGSNIPSVGLSLDVQKLQEEKRLSQESSKEAEQIANEIQRSRSQFELPQSPQTQSNAPLQFESLGPDQRDFRDPNGAVVSKGDEDLTTPEAYSYAQRMVTPEDLEEHANRMDLRAAKVKYNDEARQALRREADKAREQAKELRKSLEPKFQAVAGVGLVKITKNAAKGTDEVETIVKTPKDDDSVWDKVNPAMYTPESRRVFMDNYKKTGQYNYNLLEVNPKMTVAAGAAKGGTEAWEAIGKAAGPVMQDQYEKAQGHVVSIETVNNALEALDAGAITGFGADYYIGFGRFLASVGFDAAKDPVQNSQKFASITGTLIGQIIKQFGAGTGLSDADREYAQKIAGGDVALEESTIRWLLNKHAQASRVWLEKYNARASKIDKSMESNGLPAIWSVDIPAVREGETKEQRLKRIKEKYGGQ